MMKGIRSVSNDHQEVKLTFGLAPDGRLTIPHSQDIIEATRILLSRPETIPAAPALADFALAVMRLERQLDTLADHSGLTDLRGKQELRLVEQPRTPLATVDRFTCDHPPRFLQPHPANGTNWGDGMNLCGQCGATLYPVDPAPADQARPGGALP